MNTGEQYLQHSNMRKPKEYATHVEVFATAFLLGKDVHVWVGSAGWQSHHASGDPDRATHNGIYLVNSGDHFTVVLGPREAS